MNQQQHGTHITSLPQRLLDSQQIIYQPRTQQHHTPQHRFQHQQSPSFNHPYAVSHGHTTRVLQHSQHQQRHQPELPLLMEVGSGHVQLRKGRWSPSEDDRLRMSIRRHGPNKWKHVAKDVMTRSGDQCWKRWNDSLDPHLNHSQFLPSEDAILEAAVLRSGRMWSKIANDSLPGRSGLACKNRWDHIQRKQRRLHQSQREAFQGHSSPRSFLDSVIFPTQRNILPRSSNHLDTGNSTLHSRFTSHSAVFQRPIPATTTSFQSQRSSFNHEEDSRSLVPSNGGPLFHRNSSHRPTHPASFAPFASSSWGGIAGQRNSSSALSPYMNHNSSFSSPKTDSAVLTTTTTHGYSSHSLFQGTTAGNSVMHSSSTPTPAPSRNHESWVTETTPSIRQTNTLLSILEPGACTGGILTYAEEADAIDSTANEKQHKSSSDGNDKVDCSHPTSFVTGSVSTTTPAPDLPSPWPSQTASLLTMTPRYSYASNQAALWTPRNNATEANCHSIAGQSPFYHRLSQFERSMSDDQEPPRTQQSAHPTVAESISSSHFRSSQEWQQPLSRDGCSSNDNCQQAKSLPSHPFAYSTDALLSEGDVFSETRQLSQQESRGLDTSGSDERESNVGIVNVSPYGAMTSIQQQPLNSTPKALKLEDMTHSIFYDDVQYHSQSRREQQEQETYYDEVTSDEEEGQHGLQLHDPNSCATSFGSLKERPNVSLI